MDRLTRKMCGGWGVVEGCELNTLQGMRTVTTRLAAYEDTGLLPEEIADFQENYREMAAKFADYKAAEVTGQLIVLPCRVTDTVYVIETVHRGRKYAGGRVVSAQIDRVTIDREIGKTVVDLHTETGNRIYPMEPGGFFLTREAAEKALEKGRKNGEY